MVEDAQNIFHSHEHSISHTDHSVEPHMPHHKQSCLSVPRPNPADVLISEAEETLDLATDELAEGECTI